MMEPSTRRKVVRIAHGVAARFLAVGLSLYVGEAVVSAADKWPMQIVPGVPSGTAFVDEPSVYRVEITNAGGAERQAKLVFTRIPPEKPVVKEEREVTLTPAGLSVVEFPLVAGAPSYEVLKAELFVGEDKISEAESGFLVVEKLANYSKDDPGSFFGSMFVKDEEAAQRVGIKCIRTGADWARIEPEPGKYTWDRLDAQIDAARAHKLGVVLVLRPETTPKHTRWRNLEQLSRPENIQDFIRYVEVVVSRYKDRIRAVEVINEPDLDCAHDLSEDASSTEVYARLLKAAFEKIREVAPDLPILGLGVSGVDFPNLPFSQQVLKDQPGFLDIISGHPYSYARYVGASYRPESPLKLKTKSRIKAMAELMRASGLPPRIWITEFGWALDRREKAESPAAYLHAAYTAQAITLSRAVPELEKLFWFAMMFPGLENGSSYGMYRGDAAKDKIFFPLPAAAAFATCARQLDRVKSVGDFSVAEILHVERFEAENAAVFGLWMQDADAGGGSSLLKLPESAPTASAVSALGSTLDLKNESTVKITAMPVFFTVPLDQGDAFDKALRASRVQASEPLVIRTVRLIGEATARVEILNNYGRDLSVKIFEAGDVERAQSRKLTPGMNQVRISIDPRKEKEGVLRVSLLDEISKETLEGEGSYHLETLTALHDRSFELLEDMLADAPRIVLDQREQVLPADPGVDWKGAQDLSAVVQMGWTPEGWAILVKVQDDIHVGSVSSENLWAYDSLQLVFDMEQANDDNLGEGCLELTVALSNSGPVVTETYPSGKLLTDLPVEVKREEARTVYKILVPWSKLGRSQSPEGEVLRMNLIVNDNDGQKRKCWIGITPGIGEAKTPGIYKQWLIKR